MSFGLMIVSIVALASFQTPPAPGKPPLLADLPDYVFAVPPEDENLDVVYFGETRPLVIRFQVRINGQGYRSRWDDFLVKLYRFADGNNDGILTQAEANRPGWNQLVANPYGGIGGMGNLTQGDGKTVLEVKDGKVSLDSFIRYVRDGLGHGALQSQLNLDAMPIHQLTFNQLDLDRDGSLTSTELASAEAMIRRLDADEDEVIDQAELDPNRSPFAGIFLAFTDTPTDPLGGPFVTLASAEARVRVANRLVDRYDGADGSSRDDKLSMVEFYLTPETFRRADTTNDGQLDRAEVARWLDDPSPNLVLILQVAKAAGQPASLRLPTADPRIKTRPDGNLALDLEGCQVQLNARNSVVDFRQFFEAQFETHDLDKNGAIDRTESSQDQFFPRIFDSVDRDLDGKFTRAELKLYLDLTIDLAQSRASITIADAGRTFFTLLDTNEDGRLGRRELREAALILKPLDRDGDNRLRFEEIPNTFQITTGRGQPFRNQRRFNQDTYDSPEPTRPRTKGSAPLVAWFRQMDRNRDGDVSIGEFLGPVEDFRKLDRDGDGLIDEREASQGP